MKTSYHLEGLVLFHSDFILHSLPTDFYYKVYSSCKENVLIISHRGCVLAMKGNAEDTHFIWNANRYQGYLGKKVHSDGRETKRGAWNSFYLSYFMSTTVSFIANCYADYFFLSFFVSKLLFCQKDKVAGRKNSWYFYPKKNISNVKEQQIFILFQGLFYF